MKCCACDCHNLGCSYGCQDVVIFNNVSGNPYLSPFDGELIAVLKFVPRDIAKIIRFSVIEGEAIQIPYLNFNESGETIIELYDSEGRPLTFDGISCFVVKKLPAIFAITH